LVWAPKPPLSTIASQTLNQSEATEASFAFFPKLPIEIRQQIWKLNMPGPRIVNISHDPEGMRIVELDQTESGRNPFWKAKANAGPVPALLHVNDEARSLLLKHYTLCFEKQTQGHPIYFDVARDTLCLPTREAIHAFYRRCLKDHLKSTEQDLEYMHNTEHAVRLLAIRPIPLLFKSSLDPTQQILPNYSKLERLSLVQPKGHWEMANSQSLEQKLIKKWNEAGFKMPYIERLSREDFKRRFLKD
jgi:hypothetical protein